MLDIFLLTLIVGTGLYFWIKEDVAGTGWMAQYVPGMPSVKRGRIKTVQRVRMTCNECGHRWYPSDIRQANGVQCTECLQLTVPNVETWPEKVRVYD